LNGDGGDWSLSRFSIILCILVFLLKIFVFINFNALFENLA
jgi:hypothetical protein